jgi:serine/threonine protein phosphatase PrpC
LTPWLNESEWLISHAVVTGKVHIDGGLPCQDSCAVRTSADGAWLVAVVSDGAGTASKAHLGAQAVTAGIADRLITLVPKIDARGPGVWLRDEIQRALIDVRDALRERQQDIRDFHCTVVGMLLGKTGGIILHIGDGLALGSKTRLIAEDQVPTSLSLWNDLILSPPENGEYANETSFITQDDWYAHLRTVILPDDLDIVVLMSDGVMPFVVPGGLHPNSSFIDPIVGALLTTPERTRREELLTGWLASPETYRVTGDDKTLFVALRRTLSGSPHPPITPYVMLNPRAQPGGDQ